MSGTHNSRSSLPIAKSYKTNEAVLSDAITGNGSAVKRTGRPANSASERQLVVFLLANEYYGVDITLVESIMRITQITIVPGAPMYIDGVINMRGEVLPVVDLGKRFGLVRNHESSDTRIIVMEINHWRVGMVVDAVTEVLRVPESDIEPPTPLVTALDTAFISGIAKIPDRLVILLDARKVILTEDKGDLMRLAT